MYFIKESAAITISPYSGIYCEETGIEKEKYYRLLSDAIKDAKLLADVSRISFDIVEIKYEMVLTIL
jgi:hypothetical protein